MSRLAVLASIALVCVVLVSPALAQSPSVLYTFPTPANISQWIRNFGAANTSATLTNPAGGALTITETGTAVGGTQAFSDDFNRVRETPSGGSGGLDLTGLDFLDFDLGHNGTGDINVQFFVQATPASSFLALGPDLAVAPGLNTYQVPLSGLTSAQQVYVRTLGINIRDHAAQGNLTWTLGEVRSGGTPLTQRNLVTHDVGTVEGGLQGAIVNFDNAAVQGNNGGQNQTGLSHNASGSGSLQWTDLGGSQGAAISWGNGTAFAGNTFNMRETDLSNYDTVLVRISATDPTGGGGELGLNAFFQTNNFTFQSAEGGAGRTIPIDGQFHDLVWSLAGMSNMNVVDLTGINLFPHAQNLVINVDLVQFNVIPEPAGAITAGTLLALALRRRSRMTRSLV